jgi:predicted nucleic acid-binding Zn ribbon protein
MAKNDEHQNMSEVLKGFIEKNKLQKGLDKVDVRQAWEDQMGPAIKKYTTGLQLKDKTLFVRLSSSVLREELNYGKQKIIDNLNEAIGKKVVEKLVLR